MKKISLLPLFAVALSAAAVSLPADFFQRTSSLATGRWVKVRVDSTGVQQIPLDTLRRYGFEHPESVAVFGRGALPRPDQFCTEDGTPLIDGDLRPVPVRLHGDKLLFYGVGNEYLNYIERPDSVGSNYFSRPYRHIYSRAGYYLLTDSREATAMDSAALDREAFLTAPEATSARRYVLHSLDSLQGFHNGGQIYLGESLANGKNRLSWTIPLSRPVAGSDMTVSASFFADVKMPENFISLNLGSRQLQNPSTTKTASFLNNIFPTPLTAPLSGIQARLSLSITSNNSISENALEYWALTYSQQLPLRPGHACAFDMAAGDSLRVAIDPSLSAPMVWNVANPERPVILDASEGWAPLTRADGEALPRLEAFDADARQYSPVFACDVANTDLHATAADGADLLIITVPRLARQAERLADLHRLHDGLTVMVANVGDIYNEFNGGTPSPMAYKGLIRMLKDTNGSRRHLNVLLFGPTLGNCFNPSLDGKHDEFIIAYQENGIDSDLESHNINDFLGILDDYFTSRPEYSALTAGIGVLPVNNEAEADMIIDKIERYITFPDHYLYADKMLGMGGPGDKNTHLDQMKNLNTSIQNYFNRSLIFTPFAADCFYPNELREVTLDRFNNDYTLAYYLGHGTSISFNGTNPMLMKKDIHRFTNRQLPFFMFATCDITAFDRGERGIAESMLLDTDHGIIGGIMSTRMAYSTQNEAMMRLMGQALGQAKAGEPSLTESKTLGKAWAEAKSQLRTSHENTFSLVADPALKLALPVLQVKLNEEDIVVTPGQKVRLTGKITTRKGTEVSDFNGKICAKVIGPTTSLVCPNLVSHDQVPKPRTVSFADNVLSTSYGTVSDGTFTIDVEAPVCAELRDRISISLAFSAYDNGRQVGASSIETVGVELPDPSAADEYADTEAPVIVSTAYNPDTRQLTAVLSDNRSINVHGHTFNPGIGLFLDGSRAEEAATFDVEPGEPMTVTATLAADGLDAGEHSLRIRVADYAGNVTEETFTFEAGERPALCRLDAPVYIDSPEARFLISETASAVPTGTLTIASLEGMTLMTFPFEGTDFTVSITGDDGAMLPEGLYQAYVVINGPGFESSRPRTFAVVNPQTPAKQ